jgi:hypothetical protein
MQTLLSIYFTDFQEEQVTYSNKQVTTHLEEWFEDGWRVLSMVPVGHGGGESSAVSGWVLVLLEKE